MAEPVERYSHQHHYSNSTDGARAFWDAQQRSGS
jgi:hypothetical protein